ncbi:hypothetical protein [Dactylosporangium sp. NPDC051484]
MATVSASSAAVLLPALLPVPLLALGVLLLLLLLLLAVGLDVASAPLEV